MSEAESPGLRRRVAARDSVAQGLLLPSGMAVTLVPVLSCFVVGRYVFKMNAALLLGAVTGAMTSTAALQQVSGIARSTVPMLGYVGTYAFANVLLALAGGVIMRL